jgi:hypothetical protein
MLIGTSGANFMVGRSAQLNAHARLGGPVVWNFVD